MRVTDVMTQAVITTTAKAPVKEAAAVLATFGSYEAFARRREEAPPGLRPSSGPGSRPWSRRPRSLYYRRRYRGLDHHRADRLDRVQNTPEPGSGNPGFGDRCSSL